MALLLLPVGHVIWPNVLVGVVTGRCSMAASDLSSIGTKMFMFDLLSFEEYCHVPSGFQVKEIR